MHRSNVDKNLFSFHTLFIPDIFIEKDGQSTNFENVDELGEWHNARVSYCIESKSKKDAKTRGQHFQSVNFKDF